MLKQNIKTHSNHKENEMSFLNYSNEVGNEINYSFNGNEFSELGQRMKNKMQKQGNDTELSKINLRRDSVHSENSLFEKNTKSNHSNSIKNFEKQDKAHVQSSNVKGMNHVGLYSSYEVSPKQEELIAQKINDKQDRHLQGVLKEEMNDDQIEEQSFDIKAHGNINNNNSEINNQQSPLIKKQMSKIMQNQRSSITYKTGQNDDIKENNSQIMESGFQKYTEKLPFEASQLENSDFQSKKRQQGQKQNNNNQKSRKNPKTENFMRMKSEMFKLFTFIKPKIKKFLLYRTVLGRTKQLSPEVRVHINDYSDCNIQIQQKSRINFFIGYLLSSIERLCHFLRFDKIPLFDPENKYKIVINTIIVIYNWFYIILISLQLFFLVKGPYDKIFTYIAEFAWITEMILQMNTACYHKNHFTTDRKLIMKIYLKEYFFFEVIPLIFQGRNSENIYVNVMLRLPLLLKLKGMMIIVKKLEFYILLMIKKHYLLQLFKLVVETLLLGHIIACIWNTVAEFQMHFLDVDNTWKQRINSDFSKWYNQYIECIYYAFATMMTVGTNPTTFIEKAFTALFMLVSSMQLAFIISTIDQILSDINKSQKEYKGDLNVLNQYMRRKKIDMQKLIQLKIILDYYAKYLIFH